MEKLLAWQVHEVVSFITNNPLGQYVAFTRERKIGKIIEDSEKLLNTNDYYYSRGKVDA